MSTPENHHFVPKIYLRRFAANKVGSIFKLNKNLERTYVKEVNISSICYIKNYFTLLSTYHKELHKINDNYFIEKNSFWYEKEILSKLFDAVSIQEYINKSEFKEILKIIVSIKRRNPVMFNFFEKHEITEESATKNFNDLIPNLQNIGLTDELIEQLRQKILPQIMELSTDSEFRKGMYLTGHLQDIENPDVKNIVDLISNWQPIIMYTNFECPFICSDNPGHTIDKNGNIHNTNFNNINIFVFPLSSTHCLVLRRNQIESSLLKMRIPKIKASLDDVRLVNNSTYFNCTNFILSSSKSEIIITKEFCKEKK